MEDEADNDWDRTKMVDNRRGGGVKTVTIGVGTHFTYDWAHHADAFAAASAGLPAFRAWLASDSSRTDRASFRAHRGASGSRSASLASVPAA